jgi:transcriptional regulator with XRE-family HTH domain
MDLGITQREVARRLRVDPWTVLNWEKDRRNPSRANRLRVEVFLDVAHETNASAP